MSAASPRAACWWRSARRWSSRGYSRAPGGTGYGEGVGGQSHPGQGRSKVGSGIQAALEGAGVHEMERDRVVWRVKAGFKVRVRVGVRFRVRWGLRNAPLAGYCRGRGGCRRPTRRWSPAAGSAHRTRRAPPTAALPPAVSGSGGGVSDSAPVKIGTARHPHTVRGRSKSEALKRLGRRSSSSWLLASHTLTPTPTPTPTPRDVCSGTCRRKTLGSRLATSVLYSVWRERKTRPGIP